MGTEQALDPGPCTRPPIAGPAPADSVRERTLQSGAAGTRPPAAVRGTGHTSIVCRQLQSTENLDTLPYTPKGPALLRLPRPENWGLTRGLQTACPPNSGTIKAGTCFSGWSASPVGHGWWSWWVGTHLSRIRAGRCGESSLSLAETAGDQGRKADRRWRGWTQPRLCGNRGCQRGAPGHPAPAPAPPARAARHTLLEEPARVRSQPGCLSFSEDVGCWEGVSSAFLTEAGGSETCERHRNSH